MNMAIYVRGNPGAAPASWVTTLHLHVTLTGVSSIIPCSVGAGLGSLFDSTCLLGVCR